MVVEGIYTTKSVYHLAQQEGVNAYHQRTI